MSWVDTAIANARHGLCMCGATGETQRGTSPFGYGPVCHSCRAEWERRNGRAWMSEDEVRGIENAQASALRLGGMPELEISTRRNRRQEPFRRLP